MKKQIRKGDIVLFAVLLVFLLGAQIGLLRQETATEGNGIAVVTVDGQEVARYALGASAERYTDVIQTPYGSNTIAIEGGSLSVLEADCGDRTCVHMGAISEEGQMLVCVPHRLLITIEQTGGSSLEVDGVSR